MKVTRLCSAALVLCVALWSFGFAASPLVGAVAPAAEALPRFMGVRAEYEDLTGNHPHTNTTCFLVNRSFSQPITIQLLSVHGSGGRTDQLGNHPSIQGTVIPPLGEIRVPIDNSIPGVSPQTTPDADGVRTVYVRWSGPDDALQLTATILRIPTGDQDSRDRILEQGFDVLP